MGSLVCNGCGQEKPEEEFQWRNRLSGVKFRLCNGCIAEGKRARYQQNPQRYTNSVLQRRAETRSLLEGYTGGKQCEDCREADPVVLVFDTVAGPKTVSSLAASGRNYSSLEPDIASLPVRCLNCQKKAQVARERSTPQGGATTWQPQQSPAPAKRARSPRPSK